MLTCASLSSFIGMPMVEVSLPILAVVIDLWWLETPE